MILDWQKSYEDSTEFLSTLHLAYPIINIVHGHDTFLNTWEINVGPLLLTDLQTLVIFHQFFH